MTATVAVVVPVYTGDADEDDRRYGEVMAAVGAEPHVFVQANHVLPRGAIEVLVKVPDWMAVDVDALTALIGLSTDVPVTVVPVNAENRWSCSFGGVTNGV